MWTENELRDVEIRHIIALYAWKCLQHGQFYSRWFKFHPFTWDSKLKAPVLAKNLWPWRLHFAAALTFYVLVLTRLVQVTVVQPGSTVEQIFALFVTSYSSVFILYQTVVALRRKKAVCWLGGFLILTNKCEGKFFKSVSVLS